MRHLTKLHALVDFGFKVGRAKAVQVRAGQVFWVTNTETDQTRIGYVLIDRAGCGHIGAGYAFTPAQIEKLFLVEARDGEQKTRLLAESHE